MWLNLALLQDSETGLSFWPGLLAAAGIFGALSVAAALLFRHRAQRRLTYA